MADNLTLRQVQHIVAGVNRQFQTQLHLEDFKSDLYSVSSMKDILVQRVSDELNGEWTSDMAFHKLRSAIATVLNAPSTSITEETELDTLFPKQYRKSQVKKLSEAMGFKMDILKPNGVLYGALIFIFFAAIPFSIGFDWFVGAIVMVVAGLLIYILGKTGNHFKTKTVGELSDHLAWKNYLKQKRDYTPVSEEDIRKKIEGLISEGEE